MQRYGRTQAIALGAFLFTGLGCLGFLALKMGDFRLFDDGRYNLRAQFVSASGLRAGAHVELAGVRIGQVSKIALEPERSLAEVVMRIDPNVAVQDDAIASIRTAGIIGEKFVKISPGGSDVTLTEGMEILETEPSINLEELISKYVFESSDK